MYTPAESWPKRSEINGHASRVFRCSRNLLIDTHWPDDLLSCLLATFHHVRTAIGFHFPPKFPKLSIQASTSSSLITNFVVLQDDQFFGTAQRCRFLCSRNVPVDAAVGSKLTFFKESPTQSVDISSTNCSSLRQEATNHPKATKEILVAGLLEIRLIRRQRALGVGNTLAVERCVT